MSFAGVGHAAEWLAFVACLVAVALHALHLRGVGRLGVAGRWAAIVAVAASTLALAVLTAAFLLGRLEIEYVHLYTRLDYSWAYKLVGVWGAQKGTILLWTAMTGWMVGWLLWRTRRADRPAAASGQESGEPTGDRTLLWIQFFLLVFLLGFLSLVVRQDTFAPTPERLLEVKPMGNGLNPVLLNPYIIVHPPAEFLSYALVAIPAAAALTYFATGRKDWSAKVATSSRVAWLAYTLGLGLGALWAYTTLSFGGYWAWDPVEVANLVPWLFLTAFLHTRVHNERYGSYPIVAPVLAFAALAFTLVQTIATRSGLWVSVHAFTDPTGTFAKDPFLRFVNILTVDPSVAAIAGLLGASCLLCLGLAARRAGAARWLDAYFIGCLALAGAFITAPATVFGLALEAAYIAGFGNPGLGTLVVTALLLAPPGALVMAARARQPETPGPKSRAVRSARELMGWGVAVLGVGSVTVFLLLLRGVNGLNRAVFDDWAPVLALPVVLLMVPAFTQGLLSRRAQGAAMAGGAVLGLAGGVLHDPWQIGLLAPPTLLGLLAGGYRLSLIVAPQRSPASARLAAVCLLVAGIAGLMHWSNPPSLWQVGGLRLPDNPLAQAIGLTASAAIVVLAPVVGQGRNKGAAVAGSLLGIASVGYGVGAAAGAIGLAAVLGQATDGWRTTGVWHALVAKRASYTSYSVHLIHVALLVLLFGYAASTYGIQEPENNLMVGPGTTGSFGDWQLSFAGVTPTIEDGTVSKLDVVLDATRNGRPVGEAHVRFHWVEQVQHYDPETSILRLGTQDLYVASLAFCRDIDCRGNDAWVQAHEDGVGRLQPDEPITAVIFSARSLPLMGLVWGGLNLFMFAIAMLAVAGARVPKPKPKGAPWGDVEAQLEAQLASFAAQAAAPLSSGPAAARDDPNF